MFRIAQLALVVGSLVGVVTLAVSLSHGQDAKNGAGNAPKNAAGNRAGGVTPLKRPDPNDNLKFLLEETASEPVNEEDFVTTAPVRPPRVRRPDALPGVVELSNGKQMPGLIYTTRDKNWELYVEADRTWHRIPPITVLSMTAVVDEEEMELEWRWTAMGVDERVYTGNSYPSRRLSWKIKLIDGTTLHGAIKGQPVFIDLAGTVTGPLVLNERLKGENGQTQKDLVHVKQIVISRRMMDAVAKDLLKQPAAKPANPPAAKPAGQPAKPAAPKR